MFNVHYPSLRGVFAEAIPRMKLDLSYSVIPAKAGIQTEKLDPGLRRGDGGCDSFLFRSNWTSATSGRANKRIF